ncbi:MAG: hypothetical protein Ct9H300mP25_05000 [Acidobacteriota bacterium]|nr:MAG: hypothetical protein Ct9H300mP25_05000 [Acidobacteriota bacterium]
MLLLLFTPFGLDTGMFQSDAEYESDKKWFDRTRRIFFRLALMRFQPKSHGRKVSEDFLRFLSDFHPKGMIAEKYGVMRDGGITERAIFVVDKLGAIVFARVYDIPTLPDNAEVRQALETLEKTRKESDRML